MFEAKFQSFDDRSDRGESAPRVAALRAELAHRGLDGFVVPRADRFQNEYVPPSAERLAWLTGFTGSAGLAIVLADSAVLFVDGRYQVQVRDEVDSAIFLIAHLVDNPPPAWIEANLRAGMKLGYSPWLHTVDGAERLGKACSAAGASLVAVEDNPIDAIWTDRPQPPLGAVVPHSLRFAGEDAHTKLERVRAEMQKSTADTLLVADPHAVSWLFNIRGSDVPHTPVVLAFATVPKEGRPALFIDLRKLSNEVRSYLEEIADVRPNAAFERDLAALGSEHRRLQLDPATSPEAIARLVIDNGGEIVRGSDPIAPMKAVKNATEIAGARAAQQRDGAAVTRFLAWFDHNAPHGELTEIDAVEAIESFRRETGLLKDVSFPTIAGAGGTAPSSTTASPAKPIAASRQMNFFWSIPAASMKTAPPTSHGPSRWVRRAPICGAISRSCSKAISPSPARFFPKAPVAHNSMRSHGSFSGRPGSISTTAPATVSAAISRCTRGRRAFPNSAAQNSSAA